MQSNIHSKNLHLTDDQKAYIEERVQRLTKHASRIGDEATIVNVEVHQNQHKSEKTVSLEITITAPHAIIRSEVHDISLESAADQAFEKLQKQIERYKDKSDRRHKNGKMMPEPTLETVLDAARDKGTDEVPMGKIIKRKAVVTDPPFSDEQAIEQMELLGHMFFLYHSTDTDKVSVMYKRHDGNYGVLELGQAE